jgi:ankyrin repeat protein
MPIISLLVEKGDKNMLLSQDEKGGTVLHNIVSIHRGNSDEADDDEEEDKDEEDEDEEDEDAADWDHADTVFQYLLDKGGNDLLCIRDRYGDTALSYLLKSQSIGSLIAYTWGTAMIDLGGKNLCVMKDRDGNNPMHLAVMNCKHAYLFDALLLHGGKDSVLDENNSGFTPLHYLLYIQKYEQRRIPTNILKGMMSNGGADYKITYPDMKFYARRGMLEFYVHFSMVTFSHQEHPRVLDVLENIQIMSEAILPHQPGTLGQLLKRIDVTTNLQWAINFGIHDSHKKCTPSDKVEHWKTIMSLVESDVFHEACYTFDFGTNLYPIASLASYINERNRDLLSVLYCIIRYNPSSFLSITLGN